MSEKSLFDMEAMSEDKNSAKRAKARKNLAEQLGADAPESLRLAAMYADLAENATPNATFKSAQSIDEVLRIPMLRELIAYVSKASISEKRRVKKALRFVGAPGNAKSAVANAVAQLAGRKTKIFPAAELHPEDLVLPVPVRGEGSEADTVVAVKQVLYRDLMDAEVVIIEELSRAHGPVQQAFMQLMADWTMGNRQELPNLRSIIVCDNDASEERDGGFIKKLDAAVADRVRTVRIDDNATNWRRYLAAKWSDVDLGDVYRLRDNLPPDVRRKLSPRTLEHALWCVSQGLPMEWALPIVNNRRQLLVDENGRDHTDEIAHAVANAFGLPANPKGPAGASKMRSLVNAAISSGKNIRLIGPPGIGKTQIAKDVVAQSKMPEIYMSGSATSPDNLFLPVATRNGEVTIILDSAFMVDENYVLIVDEFSRCKPEVKPKFYGMLQERRLGGIDLPHLRAVIALDNPSEVAGRRMDAGKIERAAADRFWATVELTAEETDWDTYLVETYGKPAEIVVEWWKNVLTDEARPHVSARCCERLIESHLDGLPLVNDLVYDDGSFIAEQFIHQLENLFANRTVPRLSVIVDKVDEYEQILAADEDCPQQHEVYLALADAVLPSLEPVRDVAVRMVRVLHEQHILALLRIDEPKKKNFWLSIVLEAKGKK